MAVQPAGLGCDSRYYRQAAPMTFFRVTSWRENRSNLFRRQSVTLWIAEEALTSWRAAPRTTPGGQGRYSNVVIEAALLLRQIFHLALRQTENLLESIVAVLAIDLPVPDHTTVSRRVARLASAWPDLPEGPLHLILDNNGLRIFGVDEWPPPGDQHSPAGWRILYFGVDGANGAVTVSLNQGQGQCRLPLTAGQPAGKACLDRPVTGGSVLLGIPQVSAGASNLLSQTTSTGHLDYVPVRHRAVRQKSQALASGLIRTRLRPPARGGGLIDRKRLVGLLDLVKRRGLTFVKAPAGYGKSSLLSQWFEALSAENALAGWLSLDPTENDLHSLFNYLAAALRTADPGFGRRLSTLLASECYPSARQAASAFIDDVLDAGEAVYLFIDDFHLIADPQAWEAFATILRHLPANLHWVLASRHCPPFDTSRLHLAGLMVEIGIESLRFDYRDALDFLRLAGHSLSGAEIETVINKTEGWAAGIQLASISLTQRGTDFLERISGDYGETWRFLADDVLGHLPADMVEFLERTSIVSRMTPDLCAVLSGNPNAHEMIESLERRGMFLFSLDERRCWYRYHHLFSGFLRRRLAERCPAQVSRLHLLASAWFSERGFVEEAVSHAIDADDYRGAARILENGCYDLLYSGRPSSLIQYSRNIPETVLRNHPRLQLEIAWSMILEWHFIEAEKIIRGVEVRIDELAGEHGQEWLDRMRSIVVHRKSMLYLFRDEMTDLVEVTRSAINSFPDDDPYMRGNLETNLIYGSRELYDLARIDRMDAAAREYYWKSGSTFVLVWHESIVAPAFFLRGESDRAECSLRAAMDIAEQVEGPVSPLAAMPALLLAELLYERNDCDEAAALVERHCDQAEKTGILDHLASYFVTRFRLASRAGDNVAARKTLNRGAIAAERFGFERLRRWMEHEELRHTLAENDLSLAERICALGMRDIHRMKPGSTSTSGDETFVLSWVRACRACGTVDEAIRVLKPWIGFVRERGAVRSEVRLLVALAICLTVSGKENEATRYLRDAVSKAAAPRYIRSFLDEGPVVEGMVRHLFGDGRDVNGPIACFGGELLRHFDKEQGGRGDAQPEGAELAAPETLNNREREILSMVAAGLSNKEIARRLGLTEASIKWYMQQVFMKLDVRRRINAVHRAKQFGML